MQRDPAGWLLYSPRRLLVIVVLVATVAVGAVTMLDQSESTSTSAIPAQKAADPASPARISSTRDEEASETTASTRAIERVAAKFLEQYVISPGSKAPNTMPSALQALSTPALWRGLRLTHPESLPGGRVTGTEVAGSGPFSGSVTVELTSGTTLTVSVVAWEQGWRVSNIRPADAP